MGVRWKWEVKGVVEIVVMGTLVVKDEMRGAMNDEGDEKEGMVRSDWERVAG